MTVRTGGGDTVGYQGGFISFPAATHAPDPAGQIHTESLAPDEVTTAKPALRGTASGGVPFYDAAISRWVPVSAAQSTADGTTYAWASTPPGAQTAVVHVVDTRTGVERTFPATGVGYSVSILDFASAGIYLSLVSGIGGPSRGLWRMDPASGNLTDLHQPDFALAVQNGYLWSARHTGPPTHEEYSFPDTIYRVQLSNSARTTWYQSAQAISLMGFDGHGSPLLEGPSQQPGQTGEIRLVNSAGSGGLVISAGGAFTSSQGDGDRIWFGSPDGIYLYTPESSLRKVFNFAGDQPRPEVEDINPAGFCR